MSFLKKVSADLLFLVQIFLIFVFSVPQFLRLFQNVEGQSLSMQIVILGFLILNLWLAINAHLVNSSRVTKQTIVIYSTWIIFVSGNIFAIFWNGNYVWSMNDRITMDVALWLAFGVILISLFLRIKITEPAIKGVLAIIFKSFPQCMMALKIFEEGGAGVPIITIIVGHINIGLRVSQIFISIWEYKIDRNRFWLLMSESFNEASWIFVTFAWMKWYGLI